MATLTLADVWQFLNHSFGAALIESPFIPLGAKQQYTKSIILLRDRIARDRGVGINDVDDLPPETELTPAATELFGKLREGRRLILKDHANLPCLPGPT